MELTLPLDILQEFALWSLPDEPTGSINETPVCFSHVCASWRQAALSMPRIWSRLCIKLEVTTNRSESTTKDLQLRQLHFFSNANGHPLSLHLTFHIKWALEVQQTVHLVRDFVKWMFCDWPLMQDVQHFTVISAYPWHEIVDGVKSLHLPLLETLILLNGKQIIRPPPDGNRWIQNFSNTPRLRHLTAHHGILNNPSPQILPWSQLEEIYLADTIPALGWISILDTCSNIRSGYFHVSGSLVGASHEMYIQDRCPNLHKLTIAFRNIDAASLNILQSRRLPNLIRLTFRFPDAVEVGAPGIAEPYCLGPYLPKLAELLIYDSWNTPISFRRFFLNNPTLTSLSYVIQVTYISLLWFILTVTNSESACLLPLLSSIKVMVPKDYLFTKQRLEDCNALEAMLRSRAVTNHTSNVAKLLHFHLMCKSEGDVTIRLQQMREKFTQLGVSMVIENANSSDLRLHDHTDEHYWDTLSCIP